MRTNFSSTRRATGKERLDAEELVTALSRVVKGQPEAVRAVVNALVVQDGKIAPIRPAALLLTGKSGVGKTFLANELVNAVNDMRPSEPYQIIRIDGANLSNEMGASTLTGSAPGYIGSDQPSFFESLLSHPKTVILVDEAEKMSPQAQHIFLSILEGRMMLQHAVGESSSVDFTHSLVLFTSNAVTRLQNRRIERSLAARLAELREIKLALRGSFSTPLLSRIGQVVLMRDLDEDTIAEIAESALQKSAQSFGLDLDFIEGDIFNEILDVADVANYGVREINTVIGMTIEPEFQKIADGSGEKKTVSLYGSLDSLTVLSSDEDNRRRRAG